ncbi:hypothetical protein MAPG_03771 [Magnaporthiopsis poae ATCC 64411]|uniref:N-acetyltransferase domain-containing protein n=1 Tax=Magnaporthiopsis poae (strain ATCC 64411 / 73-15) TaxID=644358 RepID=A0A0C4DUX4_MAGP6|nr:hypothetical protein MAPG_03771 [Magnaporthiopsis poae ATCC 64411]
MEARQGNNEAMFKMPAPSRLFCREPRRLLSFFASYTNTSTSLRQQFASSPPLRRQSPHMLGKYGRLDGLPRRDETFDRGPREERIPLPAPALPPPGTTTMKTSASASTSTSKSTPTTTTASASATRPRGQIRLRPATPDERETIARIHFDAFSPGPMASLLNGLGGVTEQALHGFAADLFPGPDHDVASKGERFITVAELVPEDDDGSGNNENGQAPEMVAFGKWTLYRHERDQAQWDVEEPAVSEEEFTGSSAEVMDAFIGDLHRTARALAKGEPYLHLGILACKTAHARMGAGTAILRSGLELADELGIPARLEASPPGYPLYVRHGFEPIAAQDLDITGRWGKVKNPGDNWGQDNAVEKCGPLPEGCFRTVYMRRPPKGAGAGAGAGAAGQ